MNTRWLQANWRRLLGGFALVILFFVAWWILSGLWNMVASVSGGATPPTPADSLTAQPPASGTALVESACVKADSLEVVIRSTSGHPGRWVVLGFLILLGWTAVLYYRRTGGRRRAAGAPPRGFPTRNDMPPDWARVIFFVLPVINGLVSVGFPRIWALFWSTPGSGFVALGLMVTLFTVNATGVLRTSGRVTLWLALVVLILTTGKTYFEYEYSKYECEQSRKQGMADVQPATTDSIMIGRRWSEPVEVPLWHTLRWDRANPAVAYEAKTQTGEIQSYPRGDTSRKRISGRLTHVQFRVTEPGVDSLRVYLEISRAR